ncbi:MAG: copper amine oxidase N-terminal domain-containing protein [Syntrophomonadaceae bacterium]
MKLFKMKAMTGCLALLFMLAVLPPSALAFNPQPEPPGKEIRVIVENQPLVMDVLPFITEGRTMVPMRLIFEGLGATVQWNGSDQSILAAKGDVTVQLWIGKAFALVNEEAMPLDVPPVIVGGRTMVPIRFVSEALGSKVDWDQDSRTVSIASGPSFTPDNPPDSGNIIKPAIPTDSGNIIKPAIPLKTSYALTLESTQVASASSVTADFYGRLTFTTPLSSTPLPGKNKEIHIYKLNGTERLPVGIVTTDNSGLYSYKLVTSWTGTYVAVYQSASGADLAVSNPLEVTVKGTIQVTPQLLNNNLQGRLLQVVK